ncbi:uncharacterized protein LOC142337008 isoform X2 [Convolutriloba macropyga]
MDPALNELRDQLEENNRLLRSLNERSAQNSGVNTPEGSHRSGLNSSRGGGHRDRGQVVRVPRLAVHDVSSPEIMNSVFNGHAMEPLLMQSHRDMRKKYEELEDKYRKLEDKVVTQKQQIKSMQHQKQEEAEQVEKQNQLKSVRKQLEKIKHDIKLREKLQASLPKVSSHYATTYPAYHSKYQPVLTSSDPYYYSQKDLMLHQEVDLLHKELNALDAMKYHLHY